jgi:hypothetical protein
MAAVDKVEKCINEMLMFSRVCTTKEEKRFLVKTFRGRTFKTTKLYRGSEDGFMAKDFHRLCDNKEATISLFKVHETGDCIGGYTNAKWCASDKEIWVSDNGAVVFNLTS